MRFKLLHVRPHVWFLKQKESLASKPTSDDSSSTEGPFVYKRSTSLKLVKSDPSAIGNSSDVKAASSNKCAQKQGKNVQVCTVVDAGCTCRATVTSQHKQKRGPGSSFVSSRDAGGLHDVCRPRRTQVLEVKGEKDDAAPSKRPQFSTKSSSNSSRLLGTNGSMVSRLVCKSSHDVITHTQLDAEQSHIVCTSLHDEGTQFNACTSHVRDTDPSATQLDVHELECRLRNAGLEERRRSSKKKNKLYYDEESLTSSEISSSLGTSANTDTVLTTTTSEMQDMLLNANPAFDTDVLSMDDCMMSLDDLRASIAQRKLANPSPQAPLCLENVGLMNGMSENVTFTTSPSSFGSENIKSANAVSPQIMQDPNGHIHKDKLEVFLKHVDMGVNKKMCIFKSDDVVNQGKAKQSPKASSNKASRVKEVTRDGKTAPQRAAQRIDLGMRKESNVVQHGSAKSRANRSKVCLTQGEGHGLNRFDVGSAQEGTHAHEADIDVLALEGRMLSYPEGDVGHEKQMVSSSSCEIQVLSDYNHDSQSGHNYPMLKIHVGGTSSTSDGASEGVPSSEGTLVHELMRSESAVAMVKSSYDPRQDFKESMLEMVVAKRLHAPRQLQQLLQCYLSLNPPHYHPTIIKVFRELCSELFN